MKDNNNPTMMIKARFSNQVHQLLYNMDGDNTEDTFVEIIELDKECSDTLHNYWEKRKKRCVVQQLREERGYVPKRKTTLKEWLSMQELGSFLELGERLEEEALAT